MTPEEQAHHLVVDGTVRHGWIPYGLAADIAEGIRAAIAEEREACARLMESPEAVKMADTLRGSGQSGDGAYYALMWAAGVIRARRSE